MSTLLSELSTTDILLTILVTIELIRFFLSLKDRKCRINNID